MKWTGKGTLGILTAKPRFDVKTTYLYVVAICEAWWRGQPRRNNT